MTNSSMYNPLRIAVEFQPAIPGDITYPSADPRTQVVPLPEAGRWDEDQVIANRIYDFLVGGIFPAWVDLYYENLASFAHLCSFWQDIVIASIFLTLPIIK